MNLSDAPFMQKVTGLVEDIQRFERALSYSDKEHVLLWEMLSHDLKRAHARLAAFCLKHGIDKSAIQTLQ